MLKTVTKIFKALSDQNRIRIIKMLEVRPLCVCEMTDALNLAASTVSKHLAILREANLIIDEKESRWVVYRLNHSSGEYIKELLPLLKSWLPEDETVKADFNSLGTVSRMEL